MMKFRFSLNSLSSSLKNGAYPFGLIMVGISSRALSFGRPENNKKYNRGSELNSDFAISLYETPFRSYDPQIGRFNQIDKLGEVAFKISPYVFGSNNPILRNDPLGLKDTVVNGERGETKQLENVTVTGKRKKSASVSPATGMVALTATANFGKNFSALGPGAVAAAVIGFTIYQNRENIESTLTNDNYMADQLEAIWLAMLSDPALQAQLDLLIANADVIIEELNKLGGEDYLVYQLIAGQTPTAVPNLEWGGLLGKIRTNISYLNSGDLVKVGITSKPMVIGPMNMIARYTPSQLPKNVVQGVTIPVKGKLAARFLETTLIIKYVRENNGNLPPMNKMFR